MKMRANKLKNKTNSKNGRQKVKKTRRYPNCKLSDTEFQPHDPTTASSAKIKFVKITQA
jgi:hypothetical protein